MYHNDIFPKPPIIDMTDFVDVKEIWVRKIPKMGDHIRIQRMGGLYAHHGIYVSDDEVIHFTGEDDDCVLDWSKCEVIKTSLDRFLEDGILEVKEYTEDELQDLYPPDHIVAYARACIGDKGYHLVFNNCEHFANVCTLGRFRSQQVERVLLGKRPNEEEEKDMGLFGKIGDFFGSLFGGKKSSGGGSRSTTTTTNSYTYEPDKVKVAQIEADVKLQLADKEAERIEIMKRARLEILEYETKSRIALEQARFQGDNAKAQLIISLQEKLNEIAEKRLQIIERGSLGIIKEIETFYDEIGDKIGAENDRYNTEKLPALLTILQQYEPGTVPYEIYSRQIEDDRKSQQLHYQKQIDAVRERQTMILSSFISSKDRILDQTGQITESMLESVHTQINLSSTNDQETVTLTDKQEKLPALPDKD